MTDVSTDHLPSPGHYVAYLFIVGIDRRTRNVGTRKRAGRDLCADKCKCRGAGMADGILCVYRGGPGLAHCAGAVWHQHWFRRGFIRRGPGKSSWPIAVGPPHQFLNHLTEMFGLDWYYDGVAIAVSAKSEAETETISLKDVSFSEFQRALESAGFIDHRYQLRAGPDKDSVIASGPPQYLVDVKQLAASLSPAAAAPTQVMIIRGSSTSRVEFP
jgi:hypothetical protein